MNNIKRIQEALIRQDLEKTLIAMREKGALPDTLTFSGNGEPTGHPEFPGIIDDTLALRDAHCPQAKVSVLTNAVRITREDVFNALLRVDNPLLKLDTVDPDYIRLVARPNAHYDLPAILRRMEEFGSRAIIQTMFLHGTFRGTSVDNVSERYIAPWLEELARIRPKLVTIYTIARETPEAGLEKALPAELDAIAGRIRALGLAAQVSY